VTYDLILADPPWRYSFSRSRSRRVENQYPTMSLEEVCALDVPALCAPDCGLFLWVPAPKLEWGLTVVRAWGFQYKTQRVWDKERIGGGYYTRSRHENLLVAKRGDFHPPDVKHRPPSVFVERRSNVHSEKPVCVHEWLEAAYPGLRKLEMFARARRPGWSAHGNEVPFSVAVGSRPALDEGARLLLAEMRCDHLEEVLCRFERKTYVLHRAQGGETT
jgi:N6-adenosine-specific RNA methylase IME4